MPLQDSFSSRRSPDNNSPAPHVPKPNRLPKPPSKEDLEFLLSCAQKNPNVPLALLWRKGDNSFLLSAIGELEQLFVNWVLQSSVETERFMLWTYKTSDTALIHNRINETMEASATSNRNMQKTSLQLHPLQETPEEEVVPGTTFGEHYEILSQIGVGGMGIVYKARDNVFNRIVAVKILHGHLLSDPLSKRRFEQEAKAAMTLSHPNLITMFHYGFSAQGLPFLVMDFVEGQGLDEVLKCNKQLDLTTFLQVFVQTCDAVSHAHEKGIIHRDLKPSNVMLMNSYNDCHIKIVDFGISKILAKDVICQELTQAGDLVGSPLYMSPEQCKGLVLDPRSDIYSLGCLMYHAISGAVPFEGENALQTLGKHICEAPPPFLRVNPDVVVPERLQEIIFKTLEKEPERRYESAKKLRQDLEELLPPNRAEAVAIPAPTHLLVEVGDLPQLTYEAALKVQQMLRAGSLTLTQAAQAMGRAHLQGQITLEPQPQMEENRPPEKGIETPVEAILVEAGIITNQVWRTLVQLQQSVRSGQLTKKQAMEEFRRKHPRPTVEVSKKEKEVYATPKDILELIKQAGLVSNEDIELAARLHNEEGTDLAKRLVALGKLENKTLLAARQCLSLIEKGRLRLERAVIALVYCQRSRVGIYEAVEELGWERP